MSTISSLARKAAVVATLVAGLSLTSGSASANRAPTYCWKTVTCYETVVRPIAYYVTRYDHCGVPYQVRHVCHQKVRIAVRRWVKVWH